MNCVLKVTGLKWHRNWAGLGDEGGEVGAGRIRGGSHEHEGLEETLLGLETLSTYGRIEEEVVKIRQDWKRHYHSQEGMEEAVMNSRIGGDIVWIGRAITKNQTDWRKHFHEHEGCEETLFGSEGWRRHCH